MNIKSLIAVTILTASISLPAFPVFAATNKTASTTEFLTPAEIETKARTYFKDAPVMIEIARCESKFRQYTDSGNVLRSNGMIGVFQFFETIHSVPAQKLGFDLATVDGNFGYAKHVYQNQGDTPWNGSRSCFETTLSPAATSTATLTSATKRAKLVAQIELLTKLINLLQKQLDAKKSLSI